MRRQVPELGSKKSGIWGAKKRVKKETVHRQYGIMCMFPCFLDVCTMRVLVQCRRFQNHMCVKQESNMWGGDHSSDWERRLAFLISYLQVQV